MARCLRCHGQKKVQGIGWIETDCPRCDGIGVEMPGKGEPGIFAVSNGTVGVISNLEDLAQNKPEHVYERKEPKATRSIKKGR